MPVVRLINWAVESWRRAKVEAFSRAGDREIRRQTTCCSIVLSTSPASRSPSREQHLGNAVLVKPGPPLRQSAFQPTIGIVHQPCSSKRTLANARGCSQASTTSLFEAVTALNSLTGLTTGSGLPERLALLRTSLLDAEADLTAAQVDEDHNIRHWGEVHEAAERRTKRSAEVRRGGRRHWGSCGNSGQPTDGCRASGTIEATEPRFCTSPFLWGGREGAVSISSGTKPKTSPVLSACRNVRPARRTGRIRPSP